MTKPKRRAYARNAAKAPSGLRDAVASKWTANKQAGYERRKLGSFGAASEVVHIDPAEWKGLA